MIVFVGHDDGKGGAGDAVAVSDGAACGVGGGGDGFAGGGLEFFGEAGGGLGTEFRCVAFPAFGPGGSFLASTA